MDLIHVYEVEVSFDILGENTPCVLSLDYFVCPIDKVTSQLSTDEFETVICGVSMFVDGISCPVPGWMLTTVYGNTQIYEVLMRDWQSHYAESDLNILMRVQ